METIAADFITGTEPEILESIVEDCVSLCLWERAPKPDVAAFLAEIVTLKIPLALDFIMEPGASAKVAPSVREQFGANLSEPAVDSLLSDVDRLIARFRAASGAPAIRVRLTRIVDAACAVFHTDTLSLRLLCTYHGDGTQWIPNEHANRKQLGLRGRSIGKANRAIAPDPSRIRTMPAWQFSRAAPFPATGKARSSIAATRNAVRHTRASASCSTSRARARAAERGPPSGKNRNFETDTLPSARVHPRRHRRGTAARFVFLHHPHGGRHRGRR